MKTIIATPCFNNVRRAHGLKTAIELDAAMYQLNSWLFQGEFPAANYPESCRVLLKIATARSLYYCPTGSLGVPFE
jgi:hypothetical protein